MGFVNRMLLSFFLSLSFSLSFGFLELRKGRTLLLRFESFFQEFLYRHILVGSVEINIRNKFVSKYIAKYLLIDWYTAV